MQAGAEHQPNDFGSLKDVRNLREFRVTVKNRYQLLQDLMEYDVTVSSTGKVI